MKQPTPNEISYHQRRLKERISEVESQIKKLSAAKEELSRELAKAEANRLGIQFSERKNSKARVLAENTILQAMRRTQRPMRTNELFYEARSTNFDLKENTFRTYLNRMNKKGLIKSSRRTGFWELPITEE